MSVDYDGACDGFPCFHNADCGESSYCFFEYGLCSSEEGVCAQRPEVCTNIWDPVCGCDGVTYSNACLAAMAGVSVDYAGECAEPCIENENCPEGEYCLFQNCDDRTGACMIQPEICPEIWEPVCGCDGVTYSNTCFAAMAGVSVDYEGECHPPCGGNEDCGPDQYCAFAECDDPIGACYLRPPSCPMIYDPVCGCDGVTYGNACLAAYNGMSIDYIGACDGNPCYENDQCTETSYCFFEDCELETGVCTPRPEACPDVWDPVCGCDGVTYSNACFAAMAGVSVDYPGPCEQQYCWSNEMCDPFHYCFFADCELESGVCMPRPVICPPLWDPVCGCDGATYPNECVAAYEGMSVDYPGACVGEPCTDNVDCGDAGYCYLENCDELNGVCHIRPEGCPEIYDPVCGCDGVTYGNACEAAAAGMNVDYEGPCITGGCLFNSDCDIPEDFCLKPEGACWDFGTCEPRPWPCPDFWDPVCGCDGQTHSNTCYAHNAGVSVAHAGACETCFGPERLPGGSVLPLCRLHD